VLEAPGPEQLHTKPMLMVPEADPVVAGVEAPVLDELELAVEDFELLEQATRTPPRSSTAVTDAAARQRAFPGFPLADPDLRPSDIGTGIGSLPLSVATPVRHPHRPPFVANITMMSRAR
jgi:hypothetical protein